MSALNIIHHGSVLIYIQAAITTKQSTIRGTSGLIMSMSTVVTVICFQVAFVTIETKHIRQKDDQPDGDGDCYNEILFGVYAK